MAIFQKTAVSGNCITSMGKLLEFKNGFFETDNEDEIELLKTFDCYTEVEAADVEASAEVQAPEAPAATVGTQSSASVVGAATAPASK